MTLARMIKKGDIINIKMAPDTDPQEEVVRDVSMILHMANGVDVRVAPQNEIEVIPPEEIPTEGG